MAQETERDQQTSFISDESPINEPSRGPAALPPALRHSSANPEERTTTKEGVRAADAGGEQLSLPLGMEQEARPAAPAKQRSRRRGHSGFVPVTRDPDVARSYSDNVALDYAIARGLSQVLTTLPPEELAALRAKVAQAARENSKGSSRKHS